MDAAIGIDNAGNYFGVPICNQPFLCQSGTMQNSVGMNPPPYSNYSARVAYHFSPEWTAQIGYWRSNPAFPFTDGWEGWGGTVTTPDGFTIENPNSNLFLFNVVHELDAKTTLYPHRYELMFYYNDAAQTDPATGVVHSGTSGMYIGGRQSIWRASNKPFATSVSAYASLYSTFDPQNEYGFGTQVNAGVMLHSPFASRPLDSYSINFIWNHLTDSKQISLINANTGYYTVGPDEFSLGIDANLLVAGNFILQPWLKYVWNVNTFQNPVFSGNPKDGWAFGLNYVVLLDRMLGLAPPPK
jgi:porin